MTARNQKPNTESAAFFQLLEEHQIEVKRVLSRASNDPWNLAEYKFAIEGLIDAETDIANRIGRQLLRSMSVEKLQSILLHVGAFESVDAVPEEDAATYRSENTPSHLVRRAEAPHDSALTRRETTPGPNNLQTDASHPAVNVAKPAVKAPSVDDASENSDNPSSIRTVHTGPLAPIPEVLEQRVDLTEKTGHQETAVASDEPDNCESTPQEEIHSPALTEEALAAAREKLQAHLSGESEDDANDPTTEMRERYQRLRRTVQKRGLPGSAPKGTSEITLERDQLRTLVNSQLLEELSELPSSVNRAFSGWLICRLKSFRSAVAHQPLWSTAYDEARDWIYTLTDHSKNTQPGSIDAFKGDAAPESDSWFEDAQAWEKRILTHINEDDQPAPDEPNQTDLVRQIIKESRRTRLHESKIRCLLKQYLDAGFDPAHIRFINVAIAVSHLLDENSRESVDRVLLREIGRHQKALEEEEQRSKKTELPEDWPGLSLTRGKRILMLGGTPRPNQEDRLREAFQCESFDWIEVTPGNRNASCAVEKLKNGTVDLVIVQLKFVAHAVSKPVFAASTDDHRAIGAWTYGLTGLAHTIETHLPEKS